MGVFGDCSKHYRNKFYLWGPYYIRRAINEKGVLITNIIARALNIFEPDQLQWKYFAFGEAGWDNDSHVNTISPKLGGYKFLHNHPVNTTLMLSPGAVKMEPVSEKPGYVEN